MSTFAHRLFSHSLLKEHAPSIPHHTRTRSELEICLQRFELPSEVQRDNITNEISSDSQQLANQQLLDRFKISQKSLSFVADANVPLICRSSKTFARSRMFLPRSSAHPREKLKVCNKVSHAINLNFNFYSCSYTGYYGFDANGFQLSNGPNSSTPISAAKAL